MNSSRNILLKRSKVIRIPIHGMVNITLMAKEFIDNRYFQRLYNIKQLGTCDYVFPGAKHSRGEHSLGTYYLANRLINVLKKSVEESKTDVSKWLKEIPELQDDPSLSSWNVELIKIAALCHDIGHGPYSHMFDDIVLKDNDNILSSHEIRSCMLVATIIKESNLLSQFMSDKDVRFIQSLICPDPEYMNLFGKEFNYYNNDLMKIKRSDLTKKDRSYLDCFVFQIISNNNNSLDVDKYDYIYRDSYHCGINNGFDCSSLIDLAIIVDNKIVYPEQAQQDIYNLFHMRHQLHRTVYGHKGVVSVQCMVMNIMKILNKIINIPESIFDLDKFTMMTDDYIIQYVNHVLSFKDTFKEIFRNLSDDDISELEILRKRMNTHNFYQHIGTIISDDPVDLSEIFNSNEYIIVNSKVGFVSGNKPNPLDNIYVYKTKDCYDNVKIHKMSRHDISMIIPEKYQEYITLVYRKNKSYTEIINDKNTLHKFIKSFQV